MVAATALVVVALVLAGCGVGHGSDGAPDSPAATHPSTTSAPTTTVDASDRPSGRIDLTIETEDGRTRTAHLYVPRNLSDGPVPLLVGLHGGTGWGEQFERSSGFDALADQHGFVVAYPDGVGVGPKGDSLRTWNGGVCCGPAAKQEVDDVAFVRDLVDEVERRYEIDPDRVFATGHSNGMILAYRLACEASDVFAAVAGQAGTLGVEACHPSRPISLLHVHGSADANIPVDGGPGQGISAVDFPSPREGVAAFAEADGCPTEPDASVSGKVATQTWSPCGDGTEVQFVTVAGADHGWMGSTSSLHADGLHPSKDFDTTAAVWDFLAAHPRAG